jgi:hypothetical protein
MAFANILPGALTDRRKRNGKVEIDEDVTPFAFACASMLHYYNLRVGLISLGNINSGMQTVDVARQILGTQKRLLAPAQPL